MHDLFGLNDPPAKGLSHGLHPKADAQNGQIVRRFLDQIEANACLIGCAGAGRQKDGLRPHGQGLTDADIIIAHDMRLRTQLLRVVNEVEGEAVVIVDDKKHQPLARSLSQFSSQWML